MTQDLSPTPQQPPHHPEAAPGSFELYVIIAGIFLGILLGPAVLGRLAPEVYDKVIANRVQPKTSLADFEQQTFELQAKLESTQATPAAMGEFLTGRGIQRERIKNEDQLELIRAQLRGLSRSVALIMAILVVMVLETIIDPIWQLARARLQAARYLLMGFWVALTLAQPVFLVGFPLAFFFAMILLITVSVLLSSWLQERARVKALQT